MLLTKLSCLPRSPSACLNCLAGVSTAYLVISRTAAWATMCHSQSPSSTPCLVVNSINPVSGPFCSNAGSSTNVVTSQCSSYSTWVVKACCCFWNIYTNNNINTLCKSPVGFSSRDDFHQDSKALVGVHIWNPSACISCARQHRMRHKSHLGASE